MEQFQVDVRPFGDGCSLGVGEVKTRDGAISLPTRERSQRSILRLVFGVDRFELLEADDYGAIMRINDVEHLQFS